VDLRLNELKQQLNAPLSHRFNGHFPGVPGLASSCWSKGRWKWWWQLELQVVQSSSQIITIHHHQTQHPVFLQAGCPSCSPTNSVKALKGTISHSMDLLTPGSPGVLQLCFWPLIAPDYLEGELPWLSSALWCQYPCNVECLPNANSAAFAEVYAFWVCLF